MIQKTINLYEFKECSKEIQELIIYKNSDINIEEEWWDCIYEDAENIGLKIHWFDIDRSERVLGSFILNSLTVANLIINNHGKDCDTFKLASTFLSNYNETEEVEEIESKFLENLSDLYLKLLKQEFEYLTSKERIIASLQEFYFDVNGNIENLN